MMVIPFFMVPWLLAIGGFGWGFSEGNFWGFLVGAIGVLWLIVKFSSKKESDTK